MQGLRVVRSINVQSVTLVLSAVTLAVTLFGSPFDGGFLNLNPPLVFVSEASISKGKSIFYTSSENSDAEGYDLGIRIVNAGNTSTGIRVSMSAWSENGQLLQSLLPEGSSSAVVLEPTQGITWFDRYAEFPNTVVLCFLAKTNNGFGKKELVSVYRGLKAETLSLLHREAVEASSEQRDVCQSHM